MERICDNCKYSDLGFDQYPCTECSTDKNKYESKKEKWIPKQGELIEVKSHEYDTWNQRKFIAIHKEKIFCEDEISPPTAFGWNLYRQIKKPIIKYQWIKSRVNGPFKAGSTATGISAYYTDEKAAKDPDAKEKIEWTRREYSE